MTNRHERGMRVFEQILPDMPQILEQGIGGIAPDMMTFLIDFAAGEVLSRPGLSLKDRELVTVAALIALGNASPQLGVHFRGSINAGLTPQQLVDITYVATAFSGFPAGLNALNTLSETLDAMGIAMPEERATFEQGRHERGRAVLEETSRASGQAVLDSIGEIAPDMPGFLLEFVYGEILARPALSAQQKEMIMVAAAAARGTMEPQLKVHLHAAFNVGMTREQLVEIMLQLAVYAGFPASLNGLTALRTVLAERE